ncbi:MAG: CDGSH iron-sulfur domain-containing protein [Sedimenticola sp.]
MNTPEIAGTKPIALEMKSGETVFWCSCGLSKKQPRCDGSHKETSFEPIAYTAERDATVYFCTCKRSANPPLCDGSHKHLDKE